MFMWHAVYPREDFKYFPHFKVFLRKIAKMLNEKKKTTKKKTNKENIHMLFTIFYTQTIQLDTYTHKNSIKIGYKYIGLSGYVSA